jgi:hypothetical protein
VVDPGSVGELLAAVGNHEAKALTYVAMDPDCEYGVSALHRLFLAIQGDPAAYIGTVNLPQKYCIYSYEPVGLVGRVTNDRGHIRHLKTDPDGRATALAGHLLTRTEEHPASLAQIFGKTAVRDQPGSERPPVRRLAVMRALLVEGQTTRYQADLARRSGVGELTVGHITEAFDRAGLLAYHTTPTYRMKSRYLVRTPIAVGGQGSGGLLDRAVADFLNTLVAHQRGSELTITRDEIEAHLRGQKRWQTAAALRDRLQRVMVRLAERDQVTPLAAFAGRTRHTTIEIDDSQRTFLEQLVGGIDRIAAGDPRAIAEGTRQAEQIISDPPRVRHLLNKAFGSSKQVVNPISHEEKRRRVLAALAQCDGATSEQLTGLLSPDLNKSLVRGTLSELARDGLVRGEKQPDGPYKLWYRT